MEFQNLKLNFIVYSMHLYFLIAITTMSSTITINPSEAISTIPFLCIFFNASYLSYRHLLASLLNDE